MLICVFFLLSPILLVVGLVILIIWLLCTLTCVGPLLQCCFSSCDKSTLNKVPRGVTHVTTPRGYELAVRFNTASEEIKHEGGKDEARAILPPETQISSGGAKRFPVIIPNGLAATMGTIGSVHDRLVEAGFTVCSFDRLGVGLSDINMVGEPPSVDECVEDCLLVMNSVLPAEKQWILVGPSMGAIVGTCFIAKHPERIVGFLNMDGIPHAFAKPHIREKFMGYRKIYECWSGCTWTGIMRCGVCCASSTLKSFASSTFPISYLKAQMNQSNFWKNTGLEFPLMMDCCAATSEALGPVSVLRLPKEEVTLLARVPPTENGIYENDNWKPLKRGAAEIGPNWASEEETQKIKEVLKAKDPSPLSTAFGNMVVRVMQARDYDFVGYDDEMKEMQAAEGSLQMLLAADGARYTFPTMKHGDMFRQLGAIVRSVVEIDSAATARRFQQ